jgi:hypothetical protein
MIPANSTAETIAKLQEDNDLYAEHIERHTLMIQSNLDVIEQLSPLAEWAEDPEEQQESLVLEANNVE